MNKNINEIKIPSYVANWTDKYFHQSAFDISLSLPSKRVINFLSQFKKKERIKLFRGVHNYNKKNYCSIKSWTYDKKVAERYIKDLEGKVIEKFFNSKQVLLDTTILTERQRIILGYDYKIEDKEVLILK